MPMFFIVKFETRSRWGFFVKLFPPTSINVEKESIVLLQKRTYFGYIYIFYFISIPCFPKANITNFNQIWPRQLQKKWKKIEKVKKKKKMETIVGSVNIIFFFSKASKHVFAYRLLSNTFYFFYFQHCLNNRDIFFYSCCI